MDVVKILHDQVPHGAAIDHLWVEMDTQHFVARLGIVSIIGFAYWGSVQHFIAVTTCWKAQKDAEKQHFTTFE